MTADNIIIPKPTFNQGTGRYFVKWDELGITLEISRIKDDSHCEIQVVFENGSGPELLLQPTSSNLISSRELSGLAKRLCRRTPQLNEDNWDTMLGQAAYVSIQALREGDPVIMLDDEKYGKTKPEFLLPPLFVKNVPNIIYADRGTVKTTFMLLIDLSLSLPWYNNPLGLLIPKTAKHKVLFLDWENNDQIIGWQKACIRRGMGVPAFMIPYRKCSRPLADDLPQIQNKIDETEADVIIIDSLGMAVGDDLNLTKPALAFYGALRQLPGTPIILAHTSKDKENKYKTVYGNAYYENEARSIWEAVKSQKPESNELIFTLHHRKPAPFQGLHSPIAFKFIFENDKTIVETAEPGADKRDPDKPSNTEVVLEILAEAREKGFSPKEITDRTDPKLSGNAVRKACSDLKNKEKVFLKEDNKYVLKEYFTQPLQM
jgi:hypothetical protein